MNEKQITQAAPGEWNAVEYSSVCPFNCNNSFLLLQARDHFFLCDGDGKFIKDLPIATWQEPRWSRINPSLIYFINNGNELRYSQLPSSDTRLLKKFSQFNKIEGRGESDISADGDHFVLLGDNKTIFVYEISTDTILFSTTIFNQVDGLKILPSNRIIVSNDEGLWLCSKDSTKRITQTNGHAAVGRNKNGCDILLWCNSNENPPVDCTNGIIKFDFETGERIGLISFPWNVAFHISLPDFAEFALISTYYPNGSLSGDIFTVKLDNLNSNLINLIYDTKSIFDPSGSDKGYNSQPKVSISRDGTKFVFNSNSGNLTLNYSDVWIGYLEAKKEEWSDWNEIDFTDPFLYGREYIWKAAPDGHIILYENNKEVVFKDTNKEWKFKVVNGQLKEFERIKIQ